MEATVIIKGAVTYSGETSDSANEGKKNSK